jgi:uncharacterized delta-60 repeat protein
MKRNIHIIILCSVFSILHTNLFAQVDTTWVSRYNGPWSSFDEAKALAVDVAGNVYVTGTVAGWFYDDYATVKYDAFGVQQWVQIVDGGSYDYAEDIAVDTSGNVYVTGGSYHYPYVYDYLTIKYNSAGIGQWGAYYNHGYDIACAIAVDNSGNVYVTGESDGDYATIKYNANGDTVWTRRYNNGNDDQAYAMAVDNAGNVYVTGNSYSSTTNYDWATIKYNTSGDTIWVRRYNGPGNGIDQANAIAVDGSGNVYVTGYSYGSGSLQDYTTIKYNSSGIEQWVARYNGPGNDNDEALAVTVDNSGNIYVTGRSNGLGTYYDYATIRYNSAGIEQWVKRYNDTANNNDEAYAIAVDNFGNAYITGKSCDISTNMDYVTIKYNSIGIEQWLTRYNGPDNGDDKACSIAIDGSDNVYVAGTSYGSTTYYDYVTIKYIQTQGIEESNVTAKLINDNFTVRPNPVKSLTVIRYSLSAKHKVSLNLYDISGRLVKTLVDEYKNLGNYQLTLNTNNLSAGVYFLSLETQNKRVIERLVVVK